jgi:DNA-binding XRE family transcriptional regulator
MGSIASGSSPATPMMGFGKIIKTQREALGLTQKDLGFSVGCSDGYIAHIEAEAKVPSLEICMALAQIFNMPSQNEEALLKAVENARAERSQSRIRARGAAVRRALLKHGQQDGKGNKETNSGQILLDLAGDPQLKDAMRDLQVALANPKIRPAVLTTLRAFADSAKLK